MNIRLPQYLINTYLTSFFTSLVQGKPICISTKLKNQISRKKVEYSKEEKSNLLSGLLISFLIFSSMPNIAQVPVKLYLDSPYGLTENVHLIANVNNFTRELEAYKLTGPDSRGFFSITLDMNESTELQYGFDVGGGPILADPFNSKDPVYDPVSILNIANPMITYLLPQSRGNDAFSTLDSIWALVAFKNNQPLIENNISLKLNGIEISNAGQYYDRDTREFVYYPGDLSNGEYTIELSVSSDAGTATKSTTVQRTPYITFDNKINRYFSKDITIYGRVTSGGITEFDLEVNGNISTVNVTNGEYRVPVTLTEGVNNITVAPGTGNSFSKEIEFVSLNTPILSIAAMLTSDLEVNLDVNVVNQNGQELNYKWNQLYGPEIAQWANTIEVSTQVILGSLDGDYHFRVTATNTNGDQYIAGQLVNVKNGKASIITRFDPSPWMEKMVIYEINPRSFSNTGNLNGVTDGLDELVDLGVNTIYLMPIFKSNEYSGYWTVDYYELNEVFGTKEDLKKLVDTAHEKGIRIFLDLSNSHTSTFNPYFEEPLDIGLDSPFSNFYNWTGTPALNNYTYSLNYSIPDINYNDPLAVNYILWVSEYWIKEFDIDGYRGDVAWAIYKRNPEFWQKFRERLKNLKPDIFMVSESFPPYDQVFNDGFDAVFDFNLRGYGFEDENVITNLFNGSASLDDLDDVIRFDYPNAGLPVRFADLHDFNRATVTFGLEKAKLLQSLIFTSRGIPFIWSGSEYGIDLGAYNYEVYSRNDQFGLREYIKKLIDIRAKFISNYSQMNRIDNSNSTDVYATSIKTGTDFVIAVHNFSESEKNGTMDISFLEPNCGSSFLITNLLDNTQENLTFEELESYSYSVGAYGSLFFHIGGCDFFSLPVDNFNIAISGETCNTSNNGKILITAKEPNNYVVSINGDKTKDQNFNTSVEFKNLTAGMYNICISIEDNKDYEQCYDITITEPEELSVSSKRDPLSNKLTLALSGGKIYTIKINDKSYVTSEESITLDLDFGINKLSVKADQKCQGQFEETIILESRTSIYPNPIKNNEIFIEVGSINESSIAVSLYTLQGTLVKTFIAPITSGLAYINLDGLSNGVYLLEIKSEKGTLFFKTIK